MKKLLFCRYPLIGNYLTCLLLCNLMVAVVFWFMVKSESRTHPDYFVALYAMTFTTNVLMVPLFAFTMPGLIQNKTPKQEGVWEWYSKGKKYLVVVCDCAGKLRVSWSGGYYNVSGEFEPLYNSKGVIIKHYWNPSEWTDGMWGDRVDDLANMDKYKTLDTIRDI